MAKNLLERLSNTKSRTLLLLGGVIVIVVVLIIVITSRKPNPLKNEESRAAKIPQITSIPGNVTSEKYQTLQEEDNRKRAEEAKKAGGSAVATIIGSRDQDLLGKKDTFGIEGEFGACNCPKTTPTSSAAIPTLDPALAAKLIAEIKANPNNALRLLKANPGLGKALCTQNPDLALQIMEKDKEAAKIMLKECPALAKILAEKDPALLKQLMLEDPALAKAIADAYPEIVKKLMLDDPAFARQLAKVNPDVVKKLMLDDPDFADQMGKQNPEMVKDLMRNDPAFARALAKNNPAMVKKFMLDDPEFAKLMAKINPDMVKDLMRGDPDFAKALAASNPTLVKELMKNDPNFATVMSQQNPELMKELMLDDPEFAKAMAASHATMVRALMDSDPDFAKALLAKIPSLNAILDSAFTSTSPLNDKQRLAALEAARQRQRSEQSQRAQQLQLNEQQQKQLANIMSNMESQSKAAFQSWNEIPGQVFVAGEPPKSNAGGGASAGAGSAGGGGSSGTKPALIKAGTIIFASLNTSINTDEPGPIMATITQGPFQGATVIGSIQLATAIGGNRPEKVTLNFDSLNSDQFSKTLSIKAVAIDPDTARTALATDTEHHYLLRYGTLLASSFMTGYAKVITSAGTVVTQPGNITGSTTTTSPTLSPRQQIFAALGEVGKRFGDATSTYFDTPNTITVDAGTGIGLLILSDVTAPS